MYCLIGDFVRLGSTIKDPKHSVRIASSETHIISANRPKRRILIHVWIKSVDVDSGLILLTPAITSDLIAVRDEFIRGEG